MLRKNEKFVGNLNVKKIRYKDHATVLGALNNETIYAIDFTIVGRKDVKKEFEFLIGKTTF